MQKILVVDDDLFLLEMIGMIAEGKYDVTVVNSAQKAVGLLDNNSFDLLITDIVMPEMSGIDLIRIVKKNNLKIPIVVMTGAESYIVNEVQKLDVQQIVIKPITPTKIEDAIKYVFENQKIASVCSKSINVN